MAKKKPRKVQKIEEKKSDNTTSHESKLPTSQNARRLLSEQHPNAGK